MTNDTNTDTPDITHPETQGRVLIIAGSDSSGGAGIQADIKSCAAFGAYSATAVTAVTVQNTLGVSAVEVMPADIVRGQIRAVLDDIGADVIKIGMLANAAIIDVVAEELADTPAYVVLDPVMVATSGDTLLEDDAVEALKTKLIPLCDVITPNVPEAEMLTGIKITEISDLSKAGDALLSMGAYAALMKGGHLDTKSIVDILVTEEGANMMTGPRIYSRHTHGTGCTLASALAANMALGVPLEEAVQNARDFVFEGIRSAPKFGKGNGPLNHGLAVIGEDGVTDDEPPSNNPFAVLKGGLDS
ncbi:bifunctional hydroxymethylpyrimidine kinase/phosphomethylpyrimidine kinase [Fretibacter rubidus]|uniref:bifunctional hydroxymethylpyrimidine kinase/phosphomethylpyrimidine kinase n=1 Tax=Fretibacter rubidus TaxID=570162 RepID=UPI00352A8170